MASASSASGTALWPALREDTAQDRRRGRHHSVQYQDIADTKSVRTSLMVFRRWMPWKEQRTMSLKLQFVERAAQKGSNLPEGAVQTGKRGRPMAPLPSAR